MALLKELMEHESFPKVAQLEKWINASLAFRSTRPSAQPFISVIIPAHNEEAYLGRTLEALAAQDYPLYEVIVIANGCTDHTAAVARRRCHRLLTLPEKGLGRARNTGARVANGELLLFLDADTLLEPGALSTIARQFTPRHAAGTLKGVPDSPRLGYRLIYFLKNFTHRTSLHQGSAGVILCWKSGFEAVGGFDETLEVMENSELIKRLRSLGKYRFVSGSAAVTSMRRYERAGAWRTVWLWIKLWGESWFVSLRHRAYETIR